MQVILNGEPFDATGRSEPVRNIWERYQNIVELYPDDLKGDTLVYLSDWLLERVVLAEIGTADLDMALEIFETMNDPGLRLSNTDMLKRFVLARTDAADGIAETSQLWPRRITTRPLSNVAA